MEEHGWWNLWLVASLVAVQIPSDLDSMTNARASCAPAVYVLATGDTKVPTKYHGRVAAAHGGPRLILPLHGADHNDELSPFQARDVSSAIAWLLGEIDRQR